MTTQTMGLARPNLVFFGALTGFVLTLGYVLSEIVTVGHTAFNTTSAGVMWGLPIVIYDYFLLTSTGLIFIASLSLVFGLRQFDPIAKRCVWLALAGLVGGVAVLFLELSSPLRALYAVPFNLQTRSPLFWKVLLVGAYAVLLLALILRLQTVRDHREARPVAVLTFVAALGIALVAGSVYGMMAMRPFWFGGEIPVVFLIESLAGGFAFTIFFTYMAHGFSAARMSGSLPQLFAGTFGQLFAVVIGLHLLLHGGRAVTGLWSNAEGLQVWQYLVARPLFHLGFWGGVVLPLVLMASAGLRRQPVMQILAATLMMLGLFVARYEFIIGGQLVPLFKGSWVPPLIPYVPSVTEWALLLVGVFLANLINAFGEWRLDLDDRGG
jgi:molybdopterin-containing oxidoreductase family membrane subunit